VLLFSWERISRCSPGRFWTHYANQVWSKLRSSCHHFLSAEITGVLSFRFHYVIFSFFCLFISRMWLYLFIYFFAGWGYIVAFTKVLTMYQIHYTWVYPLHYSPSFPFTWFLEQFQKVPFLHLHICVHIICTIFLLLPLSPPPLPSLEGCSTNL
jgi:hypothetical protein